MASQSKPSQAFRNSVMNQEEMRQTWLELQKACQRLHAVLEEERATHKRKMHHARKTLEKEHQKRRAAEARTNLLGSQIDAVRKTLSNDGGKNISDEIRKMQRLLDDIVTSTRPNNAHSNRQSNTDGFNATGNTTGSLLRDCISESEDENNTVIENQRLREWEAQCRSALHDVVDPNANDEAVATTSVVVSKEGTITATSAAETVPGNDDANAQTPQCHSCKRKSSGRRNKSHTDTNESPPSAPEADTLSSSLGTEDVTPSTSIDGSILNKTTSGNHKFVGTLLKPKIFLKRETCVLCGKRLGFAQGTQKCKKCKAIVHTECKDLLPLPCVPVKNTSTLHGVLGTIADYTPAFLPLVPPIVVHCIKKVEFLGMNEQGLYGTNGTLSEVNKLKKKFLRDREPPDLSNVDVPTICSILKDFFISLREPLITAAAAVEFTRAKTMNKQDAEVVLDQAIKKMPQPNRDTLAYLMLHLQKVSSNPECKMPISNLAKIFGPTLLANKSKELCIKELANQIAIVKILLQIPSDYWDKYVNPEY